MNKIGNIHFKDVIFQMYYNISEGAVEFADRYRWLFDSDGNSLIGYPEEVVLGTRKSSKEKRILAFAAGFQVFHEFNRFWLVVFFVCCIGETRFLFSWLSWSTFSNGLVGWKIACVTTSSHRVSNEVYQPKPRTVCGWNGWSQWGTT